MKPKADTNIELLIQCAREGLTIPAASMRMGLTYSALSQRLLKNPELKALWDGNRGSKRTDPTIPGTTEAEIRLNEKVIEAVRNGCETEGDIAIATGLDRDVVEGVLVKLVRLGMISQTESSFGGFQYEFISEPAAIAAAPKPKPAKATKKAKKPGRKPYTRATKPAPAAPPAPTPSVPEAIVTGPAVPAMRLIGLEGAALRTVTNALQMVRLEFDWQRVYGEPSPKFADAQTKLAEACTIAGI